jgi:hypothetical protein
VTATEAGAVLGASGGPGLPAEGQALAAAAPCLSCGQTTPLDADGAVAYPPVYALGTVEYRFPSLGTEKELAQVIGRGDSTGLTDTNAVYQALRDNRYLARQMCYVMVIGGLETYLLQPRDPADLDLLVEAVRPAESPDDIDAVVGVRGPVAPPEACNGLTVPVVIFDQLYSFSSDELRRSIPRPDGMDEASFLETADEVLGRIVSLRDNAGATDEDRALNYLALRYPRIYSATVEAHARNESLSGIEVRPAALSGARRLVDVVLSYTNRSTDVTERASVRVDVTEPFPFLVTKLAPYVRQSG